MTSLLLTASSPARRAMPQAAAALSRRSRASAEVIGRSRPAHLMTNPSTSAGSSAVNACTICASDPDAIGSLSCAASSFSSVSRISFAGMFNMVFNTLTISGPPVDCRRGTWGVLRPDRRGSVCARPTVARDELRFPRRAAGDLGDLKRWQGTRAMSAALSILLGWAVAMTRDVALADTDIAETQVRE
jgi:hypothetical protein